MAKPTFIPRTLATARAEMKAQGTNPYQLAKATGISVSSIQKLMSEKVSPSLRNIEMVLKALGFEVRVIKTGASSVKPGRAATKVAKRAKA